MLFWCSLAEGGILIDATLSGSNGIELSRPANLTSLKQLLLTSSVLGSPLFYERAEPRLIGGG
jgi:hypothetical protein